MSDFISALADQTDVASSPALMREAPAYKELLAQGMSAIPVLLDALRSGRAVVAVMFLLQDITGINPVETSERGDMKVSTLRWLDWGDKNGISASPQ